MTTDLLKDVIGEMNLDVDEDAMQDILNQNKKDDDDKDKPDQKKD